MKFFLKLLRFLWVVWAALIIFLTSFLILPTVFIILKTKSKNTFWKAHKVARFWAKILSVFTLIRFKVKGKELVDRSTPYVFISNHQSQLDILACALANPGVFRFLSKKQLTNLPFFGYLIRNLYLTVDRENKAGRLKSMEDMKKSLDEGISVHLYPEGTRNRSNVPLTAFYDGAFKLAIETGAPLVVLTIENSRKLNAPDQFPQLSPGIVNCYWDEPIITSGMTLDDMPALKEKARNVMLAHLD